jgi:hypothetical protein
MVIVLERLSLVELARVSRLVTLDEVESLTQLARQGQAKVVAPSAIVL